MSVTQKRTEIETAIRQLTDYIEQSDEWRLLFKQLINQFCSPVAYQLEEELHTIVSELLGGQYGRMTFDFLFEEMATTTWGKQGVTPIDTFLKTQDGQEVSEGHRYLQALRESSLQLLEVTAVEAGKWVEVRPFGTEAQPMRIVEHGANQSLLARDALVARVYSDGKSQQFTGAMLPLNPDAAAYVQEQLDNIPADLALMYQELVDEGEDVEGISENYADHIPDELITRLTESAFLCFAIDVLDPP